MYGGPPGYGGPPPFGMPPPGFPPGGYGGFPQGPWGMPPQMMPPGGQNPMMPPAAVAPAPMAMSQPTSQAEDANAQV